MSDFCFYIIQYTKHLLLLLTFKKFCDEFILSDFQVGFYENEKMQIIESFCYELKKHAYVIFWSDSPLFCAF